MKIHCDEVISGKRKINSNLIRIYNCTSEMKTINLIIKRHMNRYPRHLMFQLNKEVHENLLLQFETAINTSESLPFIFTE